jgi:hypothetical protein
MGNNAENETGGEMLAVVRMEVLAAREGVEVQAKKPLKQT